MPRRRTQQPDPPPGALPKEVRAEFRRRLALLLLLGIVPIVIIVLSGVLLYFKFVADLSPNGM